MKKTDVAALSSKQKQKCLSYVVAQTCFASLQGSLESWLVGSLGTALPFDIVSLALHSRADYKDSVSCSHTSVHRRLLPPWPSTP